MKNTFKYGSIFTINLFCICFLINNAIGQQPLQKNLPGDNEWYLRSFDNVRLYMYEFGTGKDTVLVLHGGFGAEHSYMLTALRPLEKQYHFVLYDQRGSLRLLDNK